jgi:polyketide synthase 12
VNSDEESIIAPDRGPRGDGGFGVADDERRLTELVREAAARAHGNLSADAIAIDRAFWDSGLGSIAGVQLANLLSDALDVPIEASVVFEYPTPRALAEYLRSVLAPATRPTRPTAAAPDHVTSDEPLAIVGMSCRLPGGVASADDLWRLIAEERSALSPFPGDRGWDLDSLFDPDPDHPGTSYVRHGGFLADADRFDAAFFGISPREALAMDPQQRLVLETTWEAIEQARIDPTGLRATQTGVYLGMTTHGYENLSHEPGQDGAYLGAADSFAVSSGRVAYALGFEGPALTVDTACSSSLVALHLAGQALRAGDCSLAVAGGVSVICTPKPFVQFSKQRGLAPDARCKAFAAAADGTAWGEGVAVLLVERLADARRNGHRVLAVIRGSAINQDGRSNGLTAPHGPAQRRVIRQALADAGLGPHDVDMVEAHGTGTQLGDPIEARALMATYGHERPPERPLWLGSVKSNLTHTLAAAGIAGVIKVVQAMRHGVLPSTLHVDRPAELDWSAGGVSLLTESRPWPRVERPRRAGVSSFGISGTNAHVILEEESTPDGTVRSEPSPAPEPGTIPWVVSGRGGPALRAQAARLADHLRCHPDLLMVDIAYALATTRTAFAHRAVVLADDRDGYLGGLEAIAAGQELPGVVQGTATPDPRIAFMFTGQGAQRVGMGRELYDHSPVFADALDTACAHLDPMLDRPLLEIIFAEPGSADSELLDRTEFTQPALFACELALVRLLEVAGVRPGVLFGHSIGELVAAYVAGVLSLTDACTLVAARGRLMQEMPPGGAMLAVAAGEHEVAESLAVHHLGLAIAAVNGPRSVVLSGDATAIAEQAAYWESSGRRTRLLRVGHAFHSPHMDGMLERFRQVAESVTLAAPQIPIISGVTGAPLTAAQACSPEYWVRQARDTVRCYDALLRMDTDGVTGYLEIGPDGVLTALARDCLPEARQLGPILRPGRSEARTVATTLARAHVHGVPLHWETLFAALRPKKIDLPTYAFQRQRYWPTGRAGTRTGADGHPWLSAPVELAGTAGHVFDGRLSRRSDSWLDDHTIRGNPVLPGTALLELALHAGGHLGCDRLDELTLHEPLLLPDDTDIRLQVEVGAPGLDGDRSLTIYARPETGVDAGEPEPWTRHATGVLRSDVEPPAGDVQWLPPDAVPVPVDDLYQQLAARGMVYGPAFRGLRAAWRSDTDVYVEASLPEGVSVGGFGIHPALLDTLMHATLDTLVDATQLAVPSGLWLPFAWSGVTRCALRPGTLRARIRVDGPDASDSMKLSLNVTDDTGRPVLDVTSLMLRPVRVSEATLCPPPEVGAGVEYRLSTAQSTTEALFRLDWVPAPAPDASLRSAKRGIAVLGTDRIDVTTALTTSGHSVLAVPDWNALALAVGAGAPAPEVVLVPCTGPDGHGTSVIQEGHAETARVLDLLRFWLADERFADSRLAVVTREAVAVTAGDHVTDLARAPIWGLVRVAQTENPDRILLLDVDRGAGLPAALSAALASGQTQAASRSDVLYVPRLARANTGTAELEPPTGSPSWQLHLEEPGDLDRLTLESRPLAPLPPGHVRIAVRAAGINFRDVLVALDIYPGVSSMGREAAGVVTEVGSDVTGFALGDRVMGVFDDAFATQADADHRCLVHIPAGWSFAQAAGFPIAFLTAYHALVDLAHLTAGESILIHSAAGGVGMAAVRLARHLGAEAFATASPGKWDALRRQGLDDRHIASSRTLDFEELVRQATDERGVDVVLNALSREFTDASLRLLPRGGRFLEMGKTDLRDLDTVTGEHPGVIYRPFDLADLELDRVADLFRALQALIADGAIGPLPVRAWDIRQAGDALRYVSNARHTGKVVLTVPVPPDPERAVLITGGTGTLGAHIARHLVTRHGARHLVLAGRNAPTAESASELTAELAARGADVRIVSCDVSVREEVAALLASIPSLGSVVHAAGIVADGTLESLDADRLDRVLRPKLDAAVHLHELTRDLDLAEFVLFSSAAGLFGNAGQANYAAANTFLDALAYHRRVAGLPACAVAWGLWASPSPISRGLDPIGHRRVARGGMIPLSTADGVEIFDAARRSTAAMTIATRWDLPALRASRAEQPPILRDLIPRRESRAGATTEPPRHDKGSWTDKLIGATEPERDRLVLELVLTQAADVLGYPAGHSIAADETFRDLGFDSLTTVELRNRLNRLTGLHLRTEALFDNPDPSALARRVSKELLRSPAADASRPAGR